MSKIELSEAIQFGIKGAVKRMPEDSKEYEALVQEADKKIDEDRFRYAHAYKKAAKYLAR